MRCGQLIVAADQCGPWHPELVGINAPTVCPLRPMAKEVCMPSSSTDQPQLQADVFRPSLQYPIHRYDEILARSAERYPENVAVVFKDVSLTYREMDALVNAFANALLHLGVHKGHTVCLLMKNRPEFVISWFAIAR